MKGMAMRSGFRTILTALAVTCGLGLSVFNPAVAQDIYPNRPVKIICPFAAGGAADLVARVVAEQFSKRLGQQFVVENRTGASGIIGTQQVAMAEPDGYTLVLGFDGTFVINPYIFKQMPFNPTSDFAPVGKIGDVPLMIVAHPSVPAKTLAELVAYSKTQPALAYGTAGTGSTQHLMIELVKQQTGANFLHVPYKGAAPAMVDVLGGHIPLVGAALAGSLEYIRGGKLRPIVISSAERSKYLPDVPTLKESGLSDLSITAWHGILAPARTPRAIVVKLNGALNAALADPEVVDKLNGIGSIAAPGTPEQFADQIKRDLARYAPVVKAAGITPE